MVILEICVDSLASAKAAIDGGADRLEVCSALDVGGLTPTAGLLKCIKNYCQQKEKCVSIFAMIRVRSGDFEYNQDEIIQMKEEMAWMKSSQLVNGFVFGLLANKNGLLDIDEPNCSQLINFAKPFPVTFHRAFDLCTNPLEACSKLIKLGFDRILTSGQAKTALAGLEVIQECVKRCGSKIKIMPGSGVNIENIERIVTLGQVCEVHLSASKECISPTAAISDRIFDQGISKWRVTDSQIVKQMIEILNYTRQQDRS